MQHLNGIKHIIVFIIYQITRFFPNNNHTSSIKLQVF